MAEFSIAGRGKESGRKRKARIYYANSEAEAKSLAERQGTLVESIKRIRIHRTLVSVAGFSHRNRDGTDRQSLIRECRVGDPIELVREFGNRHDVHAICVHRADGAQLGFIPKEIAHELVKAHACDLNPRYFACCSFVGVPHDSEYRNVQFVLLLVAPGDDDQVIREYLDDESTNRAALPAEIHPGLFKPMKSTGVPIKRAGKRKTEAAHHDVAAPDRNKGCLSTIIGAAILITSAGYLASCALR